MKNQITLGTFAILGLLFAQPSQAVYNSCLPVALGFVMNDFDKSLQTTGLIVQDRDGNNINFGKNISQNTVTVTDVLKNTIRIDIPLRLINNESTNLVIRTYVMFENYDNCRIFTTNLIYDSYISFKHKMRN